MCHEPVGVRTLTGFNFNSALLVHDDCENRGSLGEGHAVDYYGKTRDLRWS